MNESILREIPWFYLDKEEPVQEIQVEIRCMERIDAESGEKISDHYISLPEYGAEELKTAQNPLVIGKGIGGLIYVYLPGQWESLTATFESNVPDDKLHWRVIKRFFYGCTYESEVFDDKLYIPEFGMRLIELGERAVLLKYKIDGEIYYAIRKDD